MWPWGLCGQGEAFSKFDFPHPKSSLIVGGFHLNKNDSCKHIPSWVSCCADTCGSASNSHNYLGRWNKFNSWEAVANS